MNDPVCFRVCVVFTLVLASFACVLVVELSCVVTLFGLPESIPPQILANTTGWIVIVLESCCPDRLSSANPQTRKATKTDYYYYYYYTIILLYYYTTILLLLYYYTIILLLLYSEATMMNHVDVCLVLCISPELRSTPNVRGPRWTIQQLAVPLCLTRKRGRNIVRPRLQAIGQVARS